MAGGRRSDAPRLPPIATWRPLVALAVAEDLGPGDVTTPLVVAADCHGAAHVEAREPLVVCGLDVAAAVFETVDPSIEVERLLPDGAAARPGESLARVRGPMLGLLAAERTALNFLMRMCGVATFTQRFVAAVAGCGARIVDTRKTLPGWRSLDKYAAAVGGAENHRLGLYDGVLLKDNHVALAGGVGLAIKAALDAAPAGLRVQVEVESEDEAVAAVEAGADFLLLDNRTPEEVRRIVRRLAGRALLEVSGRVRLENVRELAESGVQRISIGALTHSAPAVDVALEVLPEESAAGGVRT